MKKKYYVSVQAKKVMEHQGDAAYEFEIEATPEEVEQLYALFAKMESADHASYWSAHVPYIPYHLDQQNDSYDANLKKVYELVYSLGTQETKDHIHSMGILA